MKYTLCSHSMQIHTTKVEFCNHVNAFHCYHLKSVKPGILYWKQELKQTLHTNKSLILLGLKGEKDPYIKTMQQEYPVTESIATTEATYSKASMFVNYWDRQDHHKNWNKKQLNPFLTYNAPLDIFRFTPRHIIYII